MATNKYADIEIQTAKNLLKKGYKWIVRFEKQGNTEQAETLRHVIDNWRIHNG